MNGKILRSLVRSPFPPPHTLLYTLEICCPRKVNPGKLDLVQHFEAEEMNVYIQPK